MRVPLVGAMALLFGLTGPFASVQTVDEIVARHIDAPLWTSAAGATLTA